MRPNRLVLLTPKGVKNAKFFSQWFEYKPSSPKFIQRQRNHFNLLIILFSSGDLHEIFGLTLPQKVDSPQRPENWKVSLPGDNPLPGVRLLIVKQHSLVQFYSISDQSLYTTQCVYRKSFNRHLPTDHPGPRQARIGRRHGSRPGGLVRGRHPYYIYDYLHTERGLQPLGPVLSKVVEAVPARFQSRRLSFG